MSDPVSPLESAMKDLLESVKDDTLLAPFASRIVTVLGLMADATDERIEAVTADSGIENLDEEEAASIMDALRESRDQWRRLFVGVAKDVLGWIGPDGKPSKEMPDDVRKAVAEAMDLADNADAAHDDIFPAEEEG